MKAFIKKVINPQNLLGLWASLAVIGIAERFVPVLKTAREDLYGFVMSKF
jgi:hypothetical protein